MIVRLTGGLCNQLFMWAFGRSMSLRRDEEVLYHWCRSTWDYALNKFSIEVPLVKLSHSPACVYGEKTFAFDSDAFNQPSDTYFHGYWQTEAYFKKYEETIRRELTFRGPFNDLTEGIAKRLQEINSVAIHVRRGDYLTPGTAAYHGHFGHVNLREGYYRKAIDYVLERVENPEFFVFSDDPVWCENNLPKEMKILSFPNSSQDRDLYLMSKCKHGIMANSTYSWWGNWLGDHLGRIVIAPEKWFNAEADTRDIIPDRWVKLS